MLVLAACAPARAALPHGANADACGTCHETQHAAWSTSAHATSGTSPVFVAMLPEVERAWGSTARERCVDCHAPAHGGDDGIGCVSCHAAVGNTAERDGLLRISDLVDACPDVRELDLNPLVITKNGLVAIDARVIVGAADASRMS